MKTLLYSTAFAALILTPAAASMAQDMGTGMDTGVEMESEQMGDMDMWGQDSQSPLIEDQTTGLEGLDQEMGDVTTRMSETTTREIEQALADEGFEPGNVDGQWDEQTTAALQDFQSERGIDVTGEADETTMSELGVQSDIGVDQQSRIGSDLGTESDMGLGAEVETGAGINTNYNQ